MRAATFPALSTVLACAVFMTACGTKGEPAAGGVNAAASGSPALPGAPDDLAQDGVRITGMSGWSHQETPPVISAEFEVTNHESEPFTYTITFDALSTSGAVLENTKQTVPAVGPGQTVRRTVRLNGSSPDLRGDKGRVRIAEVRRVPAAEAPAETGPCPSSGMRLTTDAGNAAMGLRVIGLRLTNCGTRAYHLNGFPLLQLLDEDRKPEPTVKIVKGSGGIATMSDFDAPARPVVLAPGQTANSGLMWRNTTDAGEAAVEVPYVRVRAKPGARPVMVTPGLDLGTTGRLAVSPWKKGPAR
ncbi:DUF4232 domain-containing protein [Actinomadura sp. KC216]|uniref:DUF4232 domain-containing protein n=1 Tax=Actinomadura sp. KC216 TaxID=2530370 RepID=UPI00104514F7|nr:DUF4232 domain-containing protein [Actinomadura sp. KC216]TDB89526.1 DUF4232 domain-containing protein [Actinomadura sp. KC216]